MTTYAWPGWGVRRWVEQRTETLMQFAKPQG